MVRKRRSGTKSTDEQNKSRKVGILLPRSTYAVYEQIARDEHITLAQVIARVAIEFVDVESEASRSRRDILGNYKEDLLGKSRPALRSAGKRG